MSDQHDTKCPIITIKVETKSIVSAETAGDILKAIGHGFERHARAKGHRDLRLGIQRVDIGSLMINLVVVGARSHQAQTVVRSFMSATEKLLLIAQGIVSGKIKRMDARLVDALSSPVADGRADRVVLSSRDNPEEIAINRSVVSLISHERSRATSVSSDEVAHRTVPEDKKQAEVPRLLELRGRPGIVLDVKGRLYVRLEGEGGVLNPLELGSGVAVEDDGVYLFDGIWEGRSYRIRAAQRIA